MRYLPYVLKHLRHNLVRTASTVAAISLCIFLFCTLRTFVRAVTFNLNTSQGNHLIVRHALSLVGSLPLAYKTRLAAVPGVRRVCVTSQFGGFLAARRAAAGPDAAASVPDFTTFFPNLAVEAEDYLKMYPSLRLPDDQKRDFLRDPRGCIIGRRLADEYGWRPGDTFFLESFVPPHRRRDGPFEFVVRGIFDADPLLAPETDTRSMYFHYAYLYEGTGRRVGAGMYTIEIADARQAGAVSRAVDALFENSTAPTKTETEAAYRAGFVSLAGNLGYLLDAIGLMVTFTILLVTANTMSMAVRERRAEIAVLKTLGFGSRLLTGLVLGESLTLGALGGALGLCWGAVAIRALPSLPLIGGAVRGFPGLGLSVAVGASGFLLALGLGLVAGLAPALQAYRAPIADLLREA